MTGGIKIGTEPAPERSVVHMEVELKYGVTLEDQALFLQKLLGLGFVPDANIESIEDHYLSYELFIRESKVTGKQMKSYNFRRLRNSNNEVFELTHKDTIDVGDRDFSRREQSTSVSQDEYNEFLRAAVPGHPVITKHRQNLRGVIDGLELTISFDTVYWAEDDMEHFVEIENLGSTSENKSVENRLKAVCQQTFGFPEDKRQAPSYLKQYIARFNAPKDRFGM